MSYSLLLGSSSTSSSLAASSSVPVSATPPIPLPSSISMGEPVPLPAQNSPRSALMLSAPTALSTSPPTITASSPLRGLSASSYAEEKEQVVVLPLPPIKVAPQPSLQFENLIVDQDAAKELQCAICLQILNKPRQCKNGHLFCLACITKSISKNPECPSCRCRLTEEILARSLFVERHIRNLKVFCKYHFKWSEDAQDWEEDDQGCPHILTLETRLTHEQKCGFAPVNCKYSPMCGKQRRMNLDAHEVSCPFRPLECTHCKKDIQFCNMEEHLKMCPMVPIECLACNVELKRGELDTHLKNDCPEAEVECTYSDQGCPKRVIRKHLEEHLCKEMPYHMVLLKKSFDTCTKRLQEEFESVIKMKDERIRQLEKALRLSDTKIVWKIKNFSSVRKKTYLQSDKFTFADFNWFIGFYTDGDNEESRGYFSIYLFLDVNHMPKGKTVTIEYFLTFVNHKDPEESVKKEFKTTFPIKGGQGWGDRKAVLASKISAENGFLKQDTLFIEAEITVKKVTWNI